MAHESYDLCAFFLLIFLSPTFHEIKLLGIYHDGTYITSRQKMIDYRGFIKIKAINLRHVLIEVHIDIIQNNKRDRWRARTNEEGCK